MNTRGLLEAAEKYLMFVTTKPPIVMERGKGMYLWDTEGVRYLDFVGGWAVTCLGHSHPAMARALSKQSRKLVSASPAYHNRTQIQFAELLLRQTCMDKVFFVSTGAEANEGAIKLARKYGKLHKGGAYEIITAIDSFHGRTLATMSATGKPQWKELFEPKVPGFIHLPLNDLARVEAAVSEKTVAIMLEPIQGESGVNPVDIEYMRALRRLCDERGILLILDEIQTGYGRTGRLFDHEHFGVEPDIMTLGKGIGGGFPLAALLAKQRFCVFEKGDQGGTYTGQSLAMAAGLAVLKEILAKKLWEHAARMGDYLIECLRAMEKDGKIRNIRGRGLLVAFDFEGKAGEDVVAECLKKRLLLNSPRPTTIRLMPPLIIEKKHADAAIAILRTVI
jgi:acetylornithine/N-succinyldiaminopimelate aminotransferase